MESLRVVIAGVGAAGVAISKILLEAGVAEIIGVDRKGAIWEGRDDLNVAKQWFAENTNPERREGTLAEVLPGADVFIGVTGPGLITASTCARWPRTRSCSPWPTPTRRSGRRRPTASPRSSPPVGATTRTRSTTSSPSPASSAARSTWAPPRSPRA